MKYKIMNISRFTKQLLMLMLFVLTITSSCLSKKTSVKIIKQEFIYEKASFPQCHASTIVETGNGFLASWFGGTHEKHEDVCIYTSELMDGKWTDPVLVADGIMNDTLRFPCWNPVLFKRDSGDIVLYYKVGPDPVNWWGLYKISSDQGKTWSDVVKIPNNLYGPIKNKPERLADGSILYPTSFENSKEWQIYVEKSSLELNNWERVNIDNNGFNAIQPTILFHGKEKIQLLCRSKEHVIVESWSDDSGKSWSPVESTGLIHNNSGIDAVTLSNGQHLLICNPIKKGRNKISLFLSDDGKDWKEVIVLEDKEKGEFSYPAIIQAADGTIHITYTYNRRKVKHVQLELI